MRSMIGLSLIEYSRKVFLPNILVVLVSVWIPISLHLTLIDTFINTVLICLSSFLSVAIAIFLVGLNRKEKELVSNIVRTKILRR